MQAYSNTLPPSVFQAYYQSSSQQPDLPPSVSPRPTSIIGSDNNEMIPDHHLSRKSVVRKNQVTVTIIITIVVLLAIALVIAIVFLN